MAATKQDRRPLQPPEHQKGRPEHEARPQRGRPDAGTRSRGAPRPGRGEHLPSRPAYGWDLLAAGGAIVAAAMLSLLPSSTALVWVGLMVLLVAPGYLLLQAMLGAPRGWHVLAGMGLSIPLIGLLALATAIVPGGFQAGAIVITITLGVLALAAVAWLRRSRTAQPVS